MQEKRPEVLNKSTAYHIRHKLFFRIRKEQYYYDEPLTDRTEASRPAAAKRTSVAAEAVT